MSLAPENTHRHKHAFGDICVKENKTRHTIDRLLRWQMMWRCGVHKKQTNIQTLGAIIEIVSHRNLALDHCVVFLKIVSHNTTNVRSHATQTNTIIQHHDSPNTHTHRHTDRRLQIRCRWIHTHDKHAAYNDEMSMSPLNATLPRIENFARKHALLLLLPFAMM